MSELPPAGWHDDPQGSGRQRRWDGRTWTDDYRDAPSDQPAEGRTWKTWHVVGVGVLSLLIGIGIGGADDATTQGDPAAAPAPAETVTVTETVTAEPEEPEEPEPATESTPTLDPTTQALIGEMAFQSVFEENRAGLADAIESDFGPSDVESVDQFTYDSDSTTMRLAVTSAYQGDEIRREVAWALTRAFVDFYGPDGLVGSTGVTPTFDLSVSSVRYVCSGEFMMRLVSRDATREDWEGTCRA